MDESAGPDGSRSIDPDGSGSIDAEWAERYPELFRSHPHRDGVRRDYLDGFDNGGQAQLVGLACDLGLIGAGGREAVR